MRITEPYFIQEKEVSAGSNACLLKYSESFFRMYGRNMVQLVLECQIVKCSEFYYGPPKFYARADLEENLTDAYRVKFVDDAAEHFKGRVSKRYEKNPHL